MRRSSSSVSWKRRERVSWFTRPQPDCGGRTFKSKSPYSRSSSSISSIGAADLQARKMLCTVLLMATCYGLVVSATTTTFQIQSGNILPQTESNAKIPVHHLMQNEGAPARDPRRRFARSGQRFKLDQFEATSATQRPENQETQLGRSGQSTQLSELNVTDKPSRFNTNTASIRNVTAQNGQSVLLHCPVEPSAEGAAVSWFRGTGELQLLSYESSPIIKDERFVVRHIVQSGNEHDWALQIKSLDKSIDSGLYQCQTNSEPPQSQYYQLNVVEPQVHILGAPDMAVKLGSSINLTCVISQSPDQLQFVFWYRDQRMINYDINERGKIVMSKLANKQDTIISNLLILNSRLSDSGNYTCMPSGARAMAIQVHVVEGSDKRLIMFQNDYDPTSAASSHQTNSALSVHVVRLSRGRLYALFLAFVIFSSWYQLVVQTQTAISLLLLAVIGFLVGKATDTDDDVPHQLENAKHFEAVQMDHSDHGESSAAAAAAGKQRRQMRTSNTKRASKEADLTSSPQSASSSLTDSCEPRSGDDSTGTMDPLIKRANGALNMLKTLSIASSEDDDDDDDDDDEGDINEPPSSSALPLGERVLPIMSCNKSIKRATSGRCDQKSRFMGKQQPIKNQEPTIEKALTSPSALSSTSSTGSTGYNSDTRSANLTRSSPTPLRVVSSSPLIGRNGPSLSPKGGLNAADYEEQMIELVRQPTALRLVMDEFSARSSSSCSQTPDRYGGELQVSGSQRPSCSRATGSLNGDQEEEDDDDDEEPHYSSPTLSFAQRPIKLVSLDPKVSTDGATCEPP